VLESDAAVARAAEGTPSILDVVGKGGRRTWLDVSVLGGTLVAYEGDKPVFATLISPGRGGVPAPGKDPLDTASTPTGTYRVDGKFVTATMVSSTNDTLVHTEVDFVQNFHGPHALHGAYWHDAWRCPRAGTGCDRSRPSGRRPWSWCTSRPTWTIEHRASTASRSSSASAEVPARTSSGLGPAAAPRSA
jgi:hypothetical protein